MSKKKVSGKKSQKKRKPAAAKILAKKVPKRASLKAAQAAQVAAKKKKAAKGQAGSKKKTAVKSKTSLKKKTVSRPATVQIGNQNVETVPLKQKGLGTRAGVGAGDYQGVSTVAHVDSESAEELLEEGQAFEAGIVSGVEDAPDADQAEVTTHEVPQDDVPDEYKDQSRP